MITSQQAKSARLELGISQNKVAKETGLSRPYLSNFELGRYNPKDDFKETLKAFYVKEGVIFNAYQDTPMDKDEYYFDGGDNRDPSIETESTGGNEEIKNDESPSKEALIVVGLIGALGMLASIANKNGGNIAEIFKGQFSKASQDNNNGLYY